ncbi:MAG TPA: 4Fe-4S binding protein [Bacillota bacterium]|nr:4Fe-4S binding protein [Bacillota bacterium]
MKTETKRNLTKYLLVTQLSIYAFIVLHAILWYVFGVHVLTKLCPFLFAEQVGRLELNFAILFWIIVFGATLVLGRAFCAWGCMFGAFQDFVARFAKFLKIKPLKKAGKWWLRGALIILTLGFIWANKFYWPSFYWFLAGTGLISLVIWFLLEKKSPSRSLSTLPKYLLFTQYLGGIIALWITLNSLRKGFSFVFDKYPVFYDEKWIIQIALALTVALTIILAEKRIFCKYMCPVGMVLRLVSAIPFPKKYKVRATGEKCTQCGMCNRECFMGLKPMEDINQYGVVKDPNCINCLVCVSKCPKNALDFTAAKNTVNKAAAFPGQDNVKR